MARVTPLESTVYTVKFSEDEWAILLPALSRYLLLIQNNFSPVTVSKLKRLLEDLQDYE